MRIEFPEYNDGVRHWNKDCHIREVDEEDGDSIWPWTWLRGELVSVDSQQSLSGTGLMRWFVPESKLTNSLGLLTSLGLTADDSLSLANALLESAAYDGAVELPDLEPVGHVLQDRQMRE